MLCFLLLGPEHADPLEFWWGPMSSWLALALAIIVAGGFAILRRLRLLEIAIGFWVTFAAGIAVLAASGHAMTARWHLGPVSDWYFWRVLVFSPEILVFLFFMITDPKTIPRAGRRAGSTRSAIGLLAALLIAPQTTEFGTKVAVLAALAIVCAARPLIVLLADAARGAAGRPTRRAQRGARSARPRSPARSAFVGLLVVAGIPARSSAEATILPAPCVGRAPRRHVLPADGVAPIDRRTARQIARDLVADLEIESAGAPPARPRPRDRGSRRRPARRRCGGRSRRGAGAPVVVPRYAVERVQRHPRARRRSGAADGRRDARRDGRALDVRGSPRRSRAQRSAASEPFELALEDGRYLIVAAQRGAEAPSAPRAGPLRGLRRRSAAGCRRAGRARLPPGRVPLRRHATSPTR